MKPKSKQLRVKQLHELLSPADLRAMSPDELENRLELSEHQMENKRNALMQFDKYGIVVKDYMLEELANLRHNIEALKAKIKRPHGESHSGLLIENQAN